MQGNSAKDFKSVDRVSACSHTHNIYLALNTLKNQRPGKEAGIGIGRIEVASGQHVYGEYRSS
jgi:hypothetical protein